MHNPAPIGRKKARRIALQALYGWAISQNDLHDIEAHVLIEHEGEKFDREYFHILLFEVTKNLQSLEELLKPHLNIPIEDIDFIELSVLRIACFEFMHRPEIPPRVIINEALELTKMYGSVEGYKFINGVLDKLAHELRKSEF